jgi:hypothetical protein
VAGKAVTLGTRDDARERTGGALLGAHAYVVTGVDRPTRHDDGYLIRLHNPWGYDGSNADANPDDGDLVVPLAQVLSGMWGVVMAHA